MDGRIAIVSGTGGPITIAADLCQKLGLRIPTLSARIQAKLKEILPAAGASGRNPIDVGIAAATNLSLYTKPVELLDSCDEVDAIFLINSGHWRGEEMVQAIADMSCNIHKPIIVALIETPEKAGQAISPLVRAGIPAFTSIEGALKAFASLVKWRRKSQQRPVLK